MAEQDLTLVIKAVDEATKTLKEVKKQLSEVTKETDKNTKANKKNSSSQKEQSGGLKNLAAGFSKLGPAVAGATAAIGTITAILAKSNAEYAQQNRLNKNLEQNLRNMGLSATAASIQLNKLNTEFDAMSRITNFDDELLSASFNKLLLVTQNVTEAQKALKISMDLSATSGKALEDTSQKVLKAYNGEYMELVELGVITKSQAEEFQKMSDKGRATAEVMDILAQKTKGAAENLTEAEKISRDLNASMDGLWETIGKGSSKVLGSFNELMVQITGGEGVGKGVFELLGDQVDGATNSITSLFRALKDKDALSALKMLYNLRTGSDTFAPTTTAQQREGRISSALSNRGIEMNPEMQSFIQKELRSIASYDPAEDKKIERIIDEAAKLATQRTITITGQEQAAGDPTALSQGRASRATLEGNMAARAERKTSSSSSSSSPKDTRTELQKANDEMDAFQKKLDDRVNSVNDLYQEMLDKKAEERELEREKGRIERANLIKLHDLREKQRENDRKHQAWLRQQEEARMAAMVANINQTSGLLQQGLSMAGAPSGLGTIVGGLASGASALLAPTLNPLSLIGAGLGIVDGISSLFGGGDAAKADEERRKRKEEERKTFEAAKRERIEFQKSLQSAIVDALRESRDNLAVTYIINQSGNYLGNDNASLRQVQSALQGTGRLERNRT